MNQHPVTMTNLLNLTHTTAITSTTNRARCRSGSHSSTDGGSRKPVSRSIGRKLLMRGDLQGRRNNLSSYRRLPRRVKSDRLLARATLHGAAEIAVPTLVSTLAISCVFT